MDIQAQTFDRQLTIQELLSGIPLQRLGSILKALVGGEFRLLSASGELVLGRDEAFDSGDSTPIYYDLEVFGHLESAADPSRLNAAAALTELLLQLSARYHMAADLHLEAVHEDFTLLQQKHAALAESEARYKALAADLDRRVQEQVKTIEAAQRQLYQAEKLASVGQLAAGVAHEINNPIGFIRSNLSTARRYVATLSHLNGLINTGHAAAFPAAWKTADMGFVIEDFNALLNESIDGVDRVAKIVADLKGFSNVDRTEEEMVDLNDNIRLACRIVAGQWQNQIELVLDLQELPRLLCLPGHLNQVFVHLLLNAAQATNDSGKIQVTSDVKDNMIRIRIRDSGCGIAEKDRERIFEPFFTTRKVGSGTGLGLSVSRDIVQAHGGRIEVESEIGIGTTFTVYLPI